MNKRMLVMNAIGVGLFFFLAAQLVLGHDELAVIKRQLPPSITSFTPLRGMPGEVITILGKNLKGNLRKGSPYIFKVDGVKAEIVRTKENGVQIVVPHDAASGIISIEEDSGQPLAKSPYQFEVIPGPLRMYQSGE